MQSSISQIAIAVFCLISARQTASADDLPLLLKEDFENGFAQLADDRPEGRRFVVEDHRYRAERQSRPAGHGREQVSAADIAAHTTSRSLRTSRSPIST